MKSTTNVFLDGLTTDMHPMSTSQKCLTDALNATLLTYNGNEQMLLNDMGNTRILDSATGNIMSLSPGFIPVGIKEHGGIMYIASVNKDGDGEIGTIPSPIIRNFYKDRLLIYISKDLSTTSYLLISNKIYPADKIMINLDMSVNPSSIIGTVQDVVDDVPADLNLPEIDPCDFYVTRKCISAGDETILHSISTPILSYSPDVILNKCTFNKGIFNVKLASKSIANVETTADASLYESQKDSNYWFYHTGDVSTVFPKDLFEATLNDDLKSFPTDSKPGYLQVKLERESIQSFGMLQRAKSPIDTPYTTKIDNDKYETYFPGFYYTTESGIYVNEIRCTIIDEETNQYIAINLPDKRSNLASPDRPIVIQFSRLPHNVTDYKVKTVIGFDEKTDIDPGLTTPVIESYSELNNADTILDPLIYPQFYNPNTNEFYLTNIINIQNIQTQYRSQTLGITGDSILPYSGLFKIKLNADTYKHWHKLQVSYYNQYNEKLGTYLCRFNPYLNDVFGSNVHVNEAGFAKAFQLGLSTTKTYAETFSGVQKLQYSTSIFGIPYLNDERYELENGVCVITLNKNEELSIDDGAKKQLKWNLPASIDTILFSNPLEFYMYQIPEYTLNISNVASLISSGYFNTFYFSENSSDWTSKLQGVLLAYPYFGDNLSKTEEVFNKTTIEGIFTWSEVAGASESDSGIKIRFTKRKEDVDQEIICLPQLGDTPQNTAILSINYFPQLSLNNELSITSITRLELNNTFLPLVIQTIICPANIGFTVSDLSHGGDSLAAERILYLYKNNSPNSRPDWKCTFDMTVGINVSTTLAVDPVYKITPYFLLKDGDTYVNKLHLTDPVFYECNLELTNEGTPKNYLDTDSRSSCPDASQFSYYQPKHVEINSPLDLSCQVDEGIYIFNITLPSIDSFTSSISKAPTITVRVGDEITVHKAHRSAGSTQMIAHKLSGYNLTSAIMWPIVIIVKQLSKIQISIDVVPQDNVVFKYQKYGLYKLKEVTSIDDPVLSKVLNKSSYILPKYQQEVMTVANENKDETEQNAFIQTYGIFFRLAYSYVEGLYDKTADNGQEAILQIKIGDKPYPKTAFVPEEPYILNYMWDTTDTSGDGNPCAAVCIYCQPTTVLTNRDNSEFAFFPNINHENNLTQLVVDFIFKGADAIKCNPSENTLLIHSNNGSANNS